MRANRNHPVLDAFVAYADDRFSVATKAFDKVRAQNTADDKISVNEVADTIDDILHRPPQNREKLLSLIPSG